MFKTFVNFFLFFLIVVDAPPTLLYSFIEQTLQPGPAVSLKCSAAGNPTPRVEWTLDGFPLPTHGRYAIYLFYQCLSFSRLQITNKILEYQQKEKP